MVESDIRGLIDPINKGEMFPYLFNIMNIVQPQGANHIFSQTPSRGSKLEIAWRHLSISAISQLLLIQF